MLSYHFRPIKLRKWFPREDSLAACFARLCILREDLLLESLGLYEENLKPPDGNTSPWRRMYFLRNLVRTLLEIRGAMETLQQVPEFKKMLHTQDKKKRDEFKDLTSKFRKAHPTLKRFRNAVGGHVKLEAVKEGLGKFGIGQEGFMGVGKELIDTHYRFAGELLAAVLVPDLPISGQKTQITKDFEDIGSVLPALSMIDELFGMYLTYRDLL